MVVGLPCAMRGVYAHGSPTATATDSAVPHDSAVPTDTERARVCNTHHPRQKRASAEPARNDPTRLIRPAPRTTPPGTTTPETLTNTHPASDVMTHHNLEPGYDRTRRGTRPNSTRNSTDLDTGYDRSRGGSGPISTRNTTDLGTQGCCPPRPADSTGRPPHQPSASIRSRSCEDRRAIPMPVAPQSIAKKMAIQLETAHGM